jgi:hypothetical protein
MDYKLELPPSSCVHPIFHVSCLKKVINNKILVQTILPDINEEGKIILELETILETRIKKLRNRAITSTSSNGRTYQWKKQHGKMISSCRNTTVSQVLRTTLV